MTAKSSLRLAVSPPQRGAGARLRGRLAVVAVAAPPPPCGVAPPSMVVAHVVADVVASVAVAA
ncbi:hypothetical protein AB870_13085 [Pandoraea faecigallinarum]|uniref:Uncharacterized protein n=1 Tax=Pandoraea faecigallinarum TaxID=656179 RepID=A0A0H3WT82_9BURK|nr:hypothetical protein AB870_13085 [Pandoraea faecigallinarum]